MGIAEPTIIQQVRQTIPHLAGFLSSGIVDENFSVLELGDVLGPDENGKEPRKREKSFKCSPSFVPSKDIVFGLLVLHDNGKLEDITTEHLVKRGED